MKKYSNVTVVIPAFNEELGIKDTLNELMTIEEASQMEIIVIDDGSTDDTYAILSEINHIKLLKHKVNRGYGASIATGVKAATREIIIWYDSDGQHRPVDLLAVVNALMDNDYDYCIGSRQDDSYVDKTRALGKWLLNKFIKMIILKDDEDFNSGLRAFKRDVIVRYLSLLPQRFGASTVTTLLMQERTYYGGNVPIKVRKRVGTSSVNQFRDGILTIALILNVVILFRPMSVFGTLGMLAILIGTVYGVVLAIVQGLGVPTLAAIIILFGFQILLFGISISQISKMRKESLEKE